MNISGTDLLTEADAFVRRHPGICGAAERDHKLPPWTLLALGSRETDLAVRYETQPGDGGHGHGPWQWDDRSGGKGGLSVAAYAEAAARHLADDLTFFKGNLKSALSAYNAGRGGAERGLAEGDSDRHTTGHDYGQDVLDRLHYLQAHRGH